MLAQKLEHWSYHHCGLSLACTCTHARTHAHTHTTHTHTTHTHTHTWVKCDSSESITPHYSPVVCCVCCLHGWTPKQKMSSVIRVSVCSYAVNSAWVQSPSERNTACGPCSTLQRFRWTSRSKTMSTTPSQVLYIQYLQHVKIKLFLSFHFIHKWLIKLHLKYNNSVQPIKFNFSNVIWYPFSQ